MQYSAALAKVNVFVSPDDGERIAHVDATRPSWASPEQQQQFVALATSMIQGHAVTHAGNRGEHGGAIDKAVIYSGDKIAAVLWFDSDGRVSE